MAPSILVFSVRSGVPNNLMPSIKVVYNRVAIFYYSLVLIQFFFLIFGFLCNKNIKNIYIYKNYFKHFYHDVKLKSALFQVYSE